MAFGFAIFCEQSSLNENILKIIAYLFGSMIIYVLYLHKIFRNGSKYKLQAHD